MNKSFDRLLFCILAIYFGASTLCCKENANKVSQGTYDKTDQKEVKDKRNSFIDQALVDSVKFLTAINKEVFPFNGHLFSSISWKDKLGANVLIISEKGNYNEGIGRKEIFAYHYVEKDSVNALLWQMNDFVDGLGCDLDIELINFFPFISDRNSNGIAETALFYSLNNRCDAVAFPAKLIVHEGENMFAIRGIRNQFLSPPQELNNKYRANDGLPPLKYKDLNTNNSRIDTSIINFYAHQWDAFISFENKKEGALPDSIIAIIN